MSHSVALIGLGRIGMLYDLNLNESDYVFSHARAFSMHPGFDLIGAVDPALALREQFSEKYKVPAFPTVSELLSHESPDVVVVASPTPTHLAVIKEVLQLCKPKLILCEKPLAYSSDDAQAIIKHCHNKGVQLFVNYIRRADPGVMEIKARLSSGQISSSFKAVVWYSKGLLHNGAHFLDLLIYWFGPVKSMNIIDPGRSVGEQDAEPDCRVEFESGTAIFCTAKEENFSHYTVEVVATNGRLRYEQGGLIVWQPAEPHPTLDHCRQLRSSIEVIENDAGRYQYRVVEQLNSALESTAHTLCTGDIGAMNIELLESLIKKRVKH